MVATNVHGALKPLTIVTWMDKDPSTWSRIARHARSEVIHCHPHYTSTLLAPCYKPFSAYCDLRTAIVNNASSANANHHRANYFQHAPLSSCSSRKPFCDTHAPLLQSSYAPGCAPRHPLINLLVDPCEQPQPDERAQQPGKAPDGTTQALALPAGWRHHIVESYSSFQLHTGTPLYRHKWQCKQSQCLLAVTLASNHTC